MSDDKAKLTWLLSVVDQRPSPNIQDVKAKVYWLQEIIEQIEGDDAPKQNEL